MITVQKMTDIQTDGHKTKIVKTYEQVAFVIQPKLWKRINL